MLTARLLLCLAILGVALAYRPEDFLPTIDFLTVHSPANVSGTYLISGSPMGGTPKSPVAGETIYMGLGCTSLNETLAKDKIVVLDRGICEFTKKYQNALNKQALALIVINTVENFVWDFGQKSTIDDLGVVMMARDEGIKLKSVPSVNLTIPFQACEGTTILTDAQGTFRSQRIPALYGPNMNCEFIIQPANGRPVSLWFDHMILENGDSIKVYNGSSTGGWFPVDHYQKPPTALYQWIDADRSPPILRGVSGCPNVRVVFSSNGDDFREAGFIAHYATCSDNNPVQLRNITTSWIEPGKVGSGCESGQNCTWLVERRIAGTPANLFFSEWYMTPQSGFQNALLTVRSGLDPSSPIIATFGNVPFPLHMTSPTGQMRLELSFPADVAGPKPARTPFTAALHVGKCSQSGPAWLGNYTGSFTDGSMESNQYLFRLNCWWYIVPPDFAPVTVSFPRFDTEAGYDIVRLFNLINNEVPGLGPNALMPFATLSGSTIPQTVTSSGHGVAVFFTSDEGSSNTGWELSYISGHCSKNFTAPVVSKHTCGILVNASTVANNNVSDCYWRIDRPDGKKGIRLFIQALSLSQDTDHLEVMKISGGAVSDTSGPVVLAFQGPQGMPNMSESIDIYESSVVVRSSHGGISHPTGSRFRLVYHAGTCHDYSVMLRAVNGSFGDGSFDEKYAENQDCSWIIWPKGMAVRAIYLKFRKFDLLEGDSVRHDCLSGKTFAGGSSIPGTQLLLCPRVTITFKSGASNPNKKGFVVGYDVSSDCPAGYYVNDSLPIPPTCLECAVGWFSEGGTPSSCTKCPVGKFANAAASGQCQNCSVGTYSDSPGQSECSKCLAGTAASRSGLDVCTTCSAGTYASASGMSACIPCPRGSFNLYGKGEMHRCLLCSTTQYQDQEGQTSCKWCPTGSWAKRKGATGQSECSCLSGYYGSAGTGKDCTKCPTGSSCAGDDALPEAQAGYFQVGNIFLPCSPREACLGGNASSCATGYHGPRCGRCKDTYARINEKCSPCPDEGMSNFLFSLIFVAPAVIVFVFVRSAKTRFKAGSMAVAVEFVQILSVLHTYRLAWPSSVDDMLRGFSLLNFNISLFSPECSSTAFSGYWLRWGFSMLIPFLFLGYLLVFFGLHSMIYKFRVNTGLTPFRTFEFSMTKAFSIFDVEPRMLVSYYINAFWIFLSLAHTYLSQQALEPFRCSRDEDGRFYLTAEPAIPCFEQDSDWMTMLPAVVFCILFYVIGIPASMFFVLFMNRKRLDVPQFHATCGAIYRVYDDKRWYWNSLVKVYKLLIVVPPVVFPDRPIWQWACALIIMFSVSVLVLRIKPHRFVLTNRLAYVANLTILVALFCGMLFYSSRLTDAETVGLQAILAALASVVLTLIVIGVILEMLTYYQRRMIGKLSSKNKFLSKLTTMKELMPYQTELAEFARDNYQLKSDGSVVGPKALVSVFDQTLRLVDAKVFEDWLSNATEGEQINAHEFLKSIHYFLWVKPGVMVLHPEMATTHDEDLTRTRTRGSSATFVMRAMHQISRSRSRKATVPTEPPPEAEATGTGTGSPFESMGEGVGSAHPATHL